MHTPRLKDVAAHADVSIATVSNVLNRPESVRHETRERVMRALAELGFVRNESARQLRMGRSEVLAYVFPDAGNPFFSDVARAAQERARLADLMLVLCDSGSNQQREDDYLALLLAQRVRGVLITPTNGSNRRLRELQSHGVPVVYVDRSDRLEAAACTVGVDDVEGGRLAVSHLIAGGHNRIGFLGSPATMPQVADRWSGALQAVEAAGRPRDSLLAFDAESLTLSQGRSAARQLLRLTPAKRPTAVFCANDLLALGLLHEVTAQRLRVPEDLAIVGYDDIELLNAAAVPVTTVRQPRQELGARAVELLLDETGEADHVHGAVVLRPELIIRASSSPRQPLL